MKEAKTVIGQIVDVLNRRIFPSQIQIVDGHIQSIVELQQAPNHFILPGFIDAHIHIESSMLVPYEFAKIALRHGTVATVSDPHEIANVLGSEGVQYMIENARDAKLKFHFGAPSCVPATVYESAGAELNADDVRELLSQEEIYYLSEMMNYPGVLNGDQEVLKKIEYAKRAGKPVDGHAPGLTGDQAIQYINAGISTDHECFTLEEAQHKLEHGMHILIREGSAARNFNALHPLIGNSPDKVMFCSDDKHPDELMNGHINELVIRSLQLGYDLFDVLRVACVNPVLHYHMNVGLLRSGDPGDFIVVENLESFKLIETYINGEIVSRSEESALEERSHSILNNFSASLKTPSDFEFFLNREKVDVIRALDGELITERLSYDVRQLDDQSVSVQDDILKICVVNRYTNAPVAIGHISGFQLNKGAIASSVAHDSHNIVVVGTDDQSICRAVNLIIGEKGGLSMVMGDSEKILPLPIAGLMSDKSCEQVAVQYSELDNFVKQFMGCALRAPFMTLSFMALLVIPKIKMSDKGLFDAVEFAFCD